jgi:hypothetical protein
MKKVILVLAAAAGMVLAQGLIAQEALGSTVVAQSAGHGGAGERIAGDQVSTVQAEGIRAGGIRIGGQIRTDDRVSAEATPQMNHQEYRLDLTAEARPTDKARFFADAWVRSSGVLSNVSSSGDLFNMGSVSPLNLVLREAYFEINGFVFDNIDIKIGRQRIAWGTADRLNPTDNVNPYDLEDIWDFGRHLGSDGVQLSVYAGEIQFMGILIPVFTPAVLPAGDWATALMPASTSLPPGLTVAATTADITLPRVSLAESITAGIKVKGSILGYDVSLSYLYVRDCLPLVDSVVVSPTATPGSVNVDTNLLYPREHIFGADTAGSIASVGVWAEAAVFLPEKVTLTEDTTLLGGGIQESVALDSSPYVKFVVGADYTFPGNVYLNVQYLHGFFQEQGADNLEDYFVFGLDWKLFDDRITISPLGVVLEIKDWRDLRHNCAILAAPSLTILPIDNAELIVGVHWIQGASTTTFGKLDGNNEVFLQAKYSF